MAVSRWLLALRRRDGASERPELECEIAGNAAEVVVVTKVAMDQAEIDFDVHGGWPFRAFMGGALDLAGFRDRDASTSNGGRG